MRPLKTVAAILFACACAFAEPPGDPEPITRFDGEVVVRATLRTANDLMLMGQLSDDPWTHSPGLGGTSDWRLSRERLPALRAAGIPFEVIIPDVQALVQAERDRLARQPRGVDWFADFKNLAAVNQRLDDLVATHPQTCSIITCGTSIQGKTIKGIRISRHPAGTSLPGIAVTGTQHAREWASTMTSM